MEKEKMQKAIDYIEENLKADIAVEEMADAAGYSVYHFYRLFQLATGMPVMQYVQRRRMLHAIWEMQGKTNRTEIILAYGFDTYAGFYRAFRNAFCCTPSEYLKTNRARRPVRPDLSKEANMYISHKKAQEVLKHWNMEEETIRDIFYENSGNRSENAYYVGERHVLKFTENLAKVKNNMALADALTEAGLHAAKHIKIKDGEAYVQNAGVYFYLTRKLEGKQLNAMHAYQPETAAYIGEIIGLLHKALAKSDALTNEKDFYGTVCNWAMESKAVKESFPAEFLAKMKKDFGMLYQTLPRQCIHRDPNPGNIMLNGEQWGFIDFELSERNIRIYDPCYAATAILSETFESEQKNGWFRVYQEMMNGYDRTVKMTNEEKRAAPYVVMGNQMICLAFFGSDEKYEKVFDINIRMTRWLMENFEKLQLI